MFEGPGGFIKLREFRSKMLNSSIQKPAVRKSYLIKEYVLIRYPAIPTFSFITLYFYVFDFLIRQNNFESFIIGSSFDDIIEELRGLDFTEDVPEIQDLLSFVSTEENEFIDNIIRLFSTDDTIFGQSSIIEEE